MSINGIGRPPGPPPGAGPVSGPAAPASAESFHVERTSSTESAEAVSSKGPLAALERGEITFDQYLDARVEEAVQPLSSRLSADDLDFLRSSLRDQLSSDPALIELVQRATGVSPASTDR